MNCKWLFVGHVTYLCSPAIVYSPVGGRKHGGRADNISAHARLVSEEPAPTDEMHTFDARGCGQGNADTLSATERV